MNKRATWVLVSWYWIIFLCPTNILAQKYYEISESFERRYSGYVSSDSIKNQVIYPYLKNFNNQNYHEASFFNRPLVYLNNKNYVLTANPIFGSEWASSGQKNFFHSFFGLNANGHFTKYLSAGVNYFIHHGITPSFAKEKTDSIPYLPYFGDFSKHPGGYSTRNFSWYLNFQPAHYLSLSAGKGNHFLGSGYRSLFLSDNVEPYPYIKTQVELDRIQYLFLISFLDNNPEFIPTKNFAPQKYTSTHFLHFNVLPNLQLGLFETVIWSADDSTLNRGLDLNYLNPVIFLRPVEFSIGSPDNVLLGLSAELTLGKAIKVYGQFLLDEYNLHFATNTYKWWGNKYGYQLGSAFFKKLNDATYSFFAEFNQVRPFTYSHYFSSKSYGHQIYSLAHPLGANFREILSGMSYKNNRFSLTNTFYIQQYASDSTGTNYGNEIYKSNATRSLENGSILLQGIQKNAFTNRFLMAYTIHPVWKTSFTLEYIFRKSSDRKTGHFLFLGIRTGLAKHDIYDARY